MITQWTPMRWPNAWKDPALLDLLKGSAIDYLLIGAGEDLSAVRSRAQQAGLQVAESAPAGVNLVKGEWPGIRMARGGPGQAAGGPTGVPWVDSNGFRVRLASALHPENSVWVDAPPANAFITPDSYLIALADSGCCGGRWVISLDDRLASSLAAGQSDAQKPWKRLTATTAFLSAHKAWSEYAAAGVVGVISDFSGGNEFFSHEALNLLARAGAQYTILLKGKLAPPALEPLKAVIYADAEPPSPAVRKQVMSFVQAGGLLITTPQWGEAPGTPGASCPVERFSMRAMGKGKIALANEAPSDPFVWANDAVVLISHRHDLVRFWNGGATASYVTVSPDRKRAIVHLLFFAMRGPDSATVRIAGRYQKARASTVDTPEVQKVEIQTQKDAVEVHLPQVSQYVVLELEV